MALIEIDGIRRRAPAVAAIVRGGPIASVNVQLSRSDRGGDAGAVGPRGRAPARARAKSAAICTGASSV
eukprot:688315-Pleurochrysis_carterae.AAC.1